jgi:hypothetical protein
MIASLAVVALLAAIHLGQIQAAERNRPTAAALRALEMAELRLQLYLHDEHPRKLHRLDRDIELAKAHVASYAQLVKEYEQFKYSSALILTLEETRLALRQAELKLEELEEDRALLLRHHPGRRRLYELEVEAAERAVRNAGR